VDGLTQVNGDGETPKSRSAAELCPRINGLGCVLRHSRLVDAHVTGRLALKKAWLQRQLLLAVVSDWHDFSLQLAIYLIVEPNSSLIIATMTGVFENMSHIRIREPGDMESG
jgi:hypothetical protein